LCPRVICLIVRRTPPLEDEMDDQRLPDDQEAVAAEGQPEDVEGHSMALVIGLGEVGRSRQQSQGRKPPEDSLPPLSKPFPRLKDEKRP
jgi:hypothetical protein